jgi:hypothetical protein
MTKTPIKPMWLRLDEKTNAIDYLDKAHIFIQQTENDTMAWKWAIIALYNALYGFAICACAGTSPDLVAPKIQKGKNKGKRQVISLNKALEHCQNPNIMEMYVFSAYLILTDNQKHSIKLLAEEFRNQFEHFPPQGWSIQLHGMSHILMDILDVIRFLAIETKNIRFTQTQTRNIKSLVFQSKKILKHSKLYIETEVLDKQSNAN